MRHVLRTSTILALALAVVGIAGVASAQQQTCIELTDALPQTPSFIYRLNVTPAGTNAVSIVGVVFGASGARVLTGGGALISGQAELSLMGTDIVISPTPEQAAVLVQHATHILLAGPSFTSGTFEHVFTRVFETAQAQTFGQTTTLNDGIATVVPCPPQG
jgi:hypothetical protein